jgi:hypothetical protein
LENGNVSYGTLRFGGVTWAGDIHLAGDARIVPTIVIGTITGNISGDYTLEQGGWDGTVILAPTSGNTFAGLKISGGTVRLGADNALSPTAVVQIGSEKTAGFLDLNGHNLSIAGLCDGPAGESHILADDLVSNSADVPVTLTINNTDDYVFGGYLAGKLSLVKYGPGKQTFVADNFNTGVRPKTTGGQDRGTRSLRSS